MTRVTLDFDTEADLSTVLSWLLHTLSLNEQDYVVLREVHASSEPV